MAPTAGKGDASDAITGALLASAEALSLGLPLEIWKTRQGFNPHESATVALRAIINKGGVRSLWAGWDAKLLEAATKGAILLWSKEVLLGLCTSSGMQRQGGAAGFIAGAGGGVAQTIVMSPLTYVITCKTKRPEKRHMSTLAILKEAGIQGCYSSAPAMAARQASNWALRQSFADIITSSYRKYVRGGETLSKTERTVCGFMGGVAACINQPTEVVRIRIQALHAAGDRAATTRSTARIIYAESGILGFYVALLPRALLSAYQTIFMVTFAEFAKEWMGKR